jgi:hypothetical protein
MRRVLPLLVVALSCTKPAPPPPATNRCDVDLVASGLFSQTGSGASAAVIASRTQLIGGETPSGSIGDVLLRNDQLRAIIQKPGRNVGPEPFGGALIDADRTRPAGEPGHDQIGKLGMIYGFGRAPDFETLEILSDGSKGGPAVVAVTGDDAVLNYLNIQKFADSLVSGLVRLVTDPDQPMPLHTTTYYVLSPGERRVRILTAFCNTSDQKLLVPVGELLDQGGSTEFFNPRSCSGGMGARGCIVDPAPWFGYQGDDVAYGMRSYRFDDLTAPETENALLNIDATVATIAGGKSIDGLATWADPNAVNRPGTLLFKPRAQRLYLRDFFVARDLGDIHAELMRGVSHGHLSVQVNGGPGARVSVFSQADQRMQTVLTTGSDGSAATDLPPGTYTLHAQRLGHPDAPKQDITVSENGSASAMFTIADTHALTVSLKDPGGAPIPGKVTVLCPLGTCPMPTKAFTDTYAGELLASNMAAVGFVPATGTLTLDLAPGLYQLVVTRGPEYSAWPDTWPAHGFNVDLSQSDAHVDATLAHVVNTTGWMSADLHVHAANSADSSVANEKRVANFVSEGVDVIVSTDHDVVTDYAPTVHALGADAVIASVIGDEVSTFDYGHYNTYPLTRRDTPNGGAFDWTGGNGPTLRLGQVFGGLHGREAGAVVQLNHGRGRKTGGMSQLKLDTATGATHEDPATFRMAPDPTATAEDTKLFSWDFDTMEVQNGTEASTALLNDWMTFLSRGTVRTATAVSDSHFATYNTGGYSRTYVKVGVDAPADFTPSMLADALRAHRAVGTSGPFIRLFAGEHEVGDTVSVKPGDNLVLTVDVQAPEWMTFDTLELYTHAAGRESWNGAENDDWPAERIAQVHTLDPAALTVEPVPGLDGFRRIHVRDSFTVQPQADTWFMVIVRSSAGPTLFPLEWGSATCDSTGCTSSSARPYAFTNPIFVDGDGSGAYDHFPLRLPASLHVTAKPPRLAARAPSGAELELLIRSLVREHE